MSAKFFLIAAKAAAIVALVIFSGVSEGVFAKTTVKKPLVTVAPVKKTAVNKAAQKKKAVTVVAKKNKKVKKIVVAKDKVVASSGAVSSVSSSAVTVLNNTCMKAITSANVFCAKIAKGCPSWSTTEKCVAANQQCEGKQQEALALCPPAS